MMILTSWKINFILATLLDKTNQYTPRVLIPLFNKNYCDLHASSWQIHILDYTIEKLLKTHG